MDQGQILLALQDTDLEIRRTHKHLDELPVKRKILESRKKRTEVQALRAKATELVARLDRALAKNEDETATIAEKIDTEQAKLMSGDITNPKEIQHLTREMDALRRRKDKLEMENLELMERAEKARSQGDKIDAALAAIDAQEKALTESFRAEGGGLQRAAEELQARRDSLVGDLEPALLGEYERIGDAKHGIAAARLLEDVCSACRTELPAERVEELQAGPDIGRCPRCRRLLVVRLSEEDE